MLCSQTKHTHPRDRHGGLQGIHYKLHRGMRVVGVTCGLRGHLVWCPMWQALCSVLEAQSRLVPLGTGRSGRGGVEGVEGSAVTGAGEGASSSPHPVASWTSQDVFLNLIRDRSLLAGKLGTGAESHGFPTAHIPRGAAPSSKATLTALVPLPTCLIYQAASLYTGGPWA